MKKSLFFLLLLFFLTLSCGDEVKDIEILIDAPAVVEEDEEFDVFVKILNTSDSEQKLLSIDIANQYLKGIMVLNIDPVYKESMRIPIFNSMNYSYNYSLVPDDTTVFKIECKAIALGDFSGDFEFCINNDMDMLSRNVRTVVK